MVALLLNDADMPAVTSDKYGAQGLARGILSAGNQLAFMAYEWIMHDLCFPKSDKSDIVEQAKVNFGRSPKAEADYTALVAYLETYVSALSAEAWQEILGGF